MNITTGITQETLRKLHEEATENVPSQHKFIINIDGDKYDAIIYCYVAYNEDSRNFMTGALEYSKSSKKTINKIVIEKFNELEKVVMLRKDNVFKVDSKDYYLGDLVINDFKKDNLVTLIAMNTNSF